MKKMIRLIGVIFLSLLISGCVKEDVRPDRKLPKPSFHQYMSEGESAEAKKDLAQALDYYQRALTAAPRKSAEQVKAHQSVLRTKRKMNEARKYCQEYKRLIKARKHSKAERVLKQVRQIWPFYSECNNLASIPTQPTQSTPDAGSYRIMNEEPVIHKIRRGDIISKLCQKYYGQTGDYKLVHIITNYNKIDAKSLYKGQEIKFPAIELSGNIYRPKGSHPQKETEMESTSTASQTTPTPKPTPPPPPPPTVVASTPTPQPTIALTPEPEPDSYFNQAIKLFQNGRYADAVALLNDVPDTSLEKEESLRLLAQCHFRLAQNSMEKARYREARDMFHQSLKICQRFQGSDLPSECEQIENLVTKCNAQIKTETIKAHFDKGKQLSNAGNIDLAIAEFEKVLALDSHHGDTLEYLYLAHFRKANRLWKGKSYREALEEFMTAWEYNQNCDECQIRINQIKGALYRKAEALEKEWLKPGAPAIKIFQEQIEYYTIINQVDPSYENVAELLKRVRMRKESLLKKINKQAE
jgi:tetratricopeptide (TPR) repeat protein